MNVNLCIYMYTIDIAYGNIIIWNMFVDLTHRRNSRCYSVHMTL